MDETTVKSHSDAQLEGHEVTHKPDLKQTNSPLTCGSGAENDDSISTHWYHNLSAEQKQLLLDNLIKMDNKSKIDYNSSYVQRVKSGIESIMAEMIKYMETCHDSFVGKFRLIYGGSFYNQTKIDRPCEFDFAIEVDSSLTVLQHLGVIKLTGSEDNLITFKLEDMCVDGFKSVNFSAVKPGWKHGGFNTPSFSGFRRSGPAMMYQFKYCDPECQNEDLNITVDVLLISPHNTSHGHLGWVIMQPSGLGCYGPVSSPCTIEWLSDFQQDSPVKTIIRLLKKLNSAGEPTVDDLLSDSQSNKDVPPFNSNMSDTTCIQLLQKSFSVKHLLIYNLLYGEVNHNEVYPSLQYLSSYVFQSIVMVLFLESASAYPNAVTNGVWCEEDIPRVIITVLDILHTAFEIKDQQSKNNIEDGPVALNNFVLHIAGKYKKFKNSFNALLNSHTYTASALLSHVKSMIQTLKHMTESTGGSLVNAELEDQTKISAVHLVDKPRQPKGYIRPQIIKDKCWHFYCELI